MINVQTFEGILGKFAFCQLGVPGRGQLQHGGWPGGTKIEISVTCSESHQVLQRGKCYLLKVGQCLDLLEGRHR